MIKIGCYFALLCFAFAIIKTVSIIIFMIIIITIIIIKKQVIFVVNFILFRFKMGFNLVNFTANKLMAAKSWPISIVNCNYQQKKPRNIQRVERKILNYAPISFNTKS